MEACARRVLQFEGGSFEPLSGVLCVGASSERLRPRTAAVLAYLMENAGRVVRREELIAHVWREVVVTDDSLSQCIKEIRRVLGVCANLIRTIPRVGYAFAGTVREKRIEPSPSEQHAPDAVDASSSAAQEPRPVVQVHLSSQVAQPAGAPLRLSRGIIVTGCERSRPMNIRVRRCCLEIFGKR